MDPQNVCIIYHHPRLLLHDNVVITFESENVSRFTEAMGAHIGNRELRLCDKVNTVYEVVNECAVHDTVRQYLAPPGGIKWFYSWGCSLLR